MRSPLLSFFIWASIAVTITDAVKITFFLRHQAPLIQELRRIFHEVSSPDSPKWGEHLSHAEVCRLQAPSAETVAAFDMHLRELGVDGKRVRRSVAGDKVVVAMEERDIAIAIAARNGLAASASPHNVSEAAVLSHVHPERMRGVVDMVSVGGLAAQTRSRLSGARPSRRRSGAGAATKLGKAAVFDPPAMKCLADKVDPTCLRTAYGLTDLKPATNANSSQAVIVNEVFKGADIAKFQSDYGLPNGTLPGSWQVTAEHTVGTNSGYPGTESSLDLQYIMTTGLGIPTWWVYIDGHASNPYSDWLVWAANSSDVPWVHSLSVGESEADFNSATGGQGVERMNAEMMALGARGVSVLFASGDSGYVAAQKYGASSPYVTAVGGVFDGELGMGTLSVDTQSTGGFSSLDENPIQPYQTAAVASWLKTKGSRPSGFNSSHRCVPDIAAFDMDFHFVKNGQGTAADGTSCAAPTAAGLFALINDALLNAGGRPLGFLNAFLYRNEAAFLDITQGDNHGFDATVGYDPASGLGTFDPTTFAKLKAAALKGRGLV